MLSWLRQTLGTTSAPAHILQNASKASVQLPLPTIATNINTPDLIKEVAPKPQLRSAKLIMVTANNNNKFYEMQEQIDGTFVATYGRVGNHGVSRSYPMTQWDRKYNEKVRKGYADQTHLFAEKKEELDELVLDDAAVQSIINELMRYSRKSIQYNYNVSADQVTAKQVAEAQAILDNLVARVRIGMRGRYFNDKLLTLFQAIPRRMNNVQNHLIKTPKTEDNIQEINEMLAQEQATLDVMRGQVEINEHQQKQNEIDQNAPTKLDLLQAMGLQMEQVTDNKLITSIQKMMGDHSKQFKRAYKVCNVRTQMAFDAHLAAKPNQKTELFWHGSRNENWLSIMKTGLVLRPANAVITGKMFGYGLYFADKFKKSLNYTSLWGSYWANGNQKKAFLALYDVHVGNQMKIKKHESWCTQLTVDKLQQRNTTYNSVFAQGGADLINNEYIIYNQNQCTIRYLVEVH